MQLTVNAVNDLPVVQNEAAQTQEDTPMQWSSAALLANDSDVDAATDGQSLSIASVSNAQHGAVTLGPNGAVHFAPEANFHGLASFQYAVSDSAGGLGTGTVTVLTTAVNDAPVAAADDATTLEDTPLVLSPSQLLANDSDVDVATDGQTLALSGVFGASHGGVSLLANGDVQFTPDANYHGNAQFSYTVSDGFGGAATANVNVNVLAQNDNPVALGESLPGTQDTSMQIAAATLLANDSDVDTATDGQVLSLLSVAGATHGTVSLLTLADGTQQVSFVPDANYHGHAQFSYTVSDGTGGSASAVASLSIAAVNHPPLVTGESGELDEDNTVYFSSTSLLANDSDVDAATDGQTLSIASLSGASNGVVGFTPDGRIYFTPHANYFGPAAFSYTVSDGAGALVDGVVQLTVHPVNDAPQALGESTGATEDTPLLIAPADLLANDSDVDDAHDTLALTAVANAQHGSVALQTQADGSQRVLFTPQANYHGSASFQYTVTDPHGLSSSATATLAIAAVNDAPVTANESAQTDEDVGLVFAPAQLLANDSDPDIATDGDSLHISRVGAAQHGSAFIDSAGNLRFAPDANYHGAAQFSYWVADSHAAETSATVSISVAAVNDLPIANGEQTSALEDTTLFISAATLLANDTDVDTATDGQVLSVSAVSNARHGSVSLLGNGTIEFVPEANFHGLASFDYTVSDGVGGAALATAVVSLLAVNDAPVAVGETASGNEDNELVFASAALLANDSDPDAATDAQTLHIGRVGSASHGSVSLDAQGQVHFLPDANYHGPAQFSYWVEDSAGAQTPATVSLTILAVNDLPVVRGEIVNSSEDVNLLLDPATLLANDSDVDTATDAQVRTISAVSNAQHGSVSVRPDGLIAFVPQSNYFGAASFDYTVSDGAGGTGGGTTSINLAEVNDPPLAYCESITLAEDTVARFTVAGLLANDTDVEDSVDQLRITAVSGASGGSVGLANGEVVFTPTLNFNGHASFSYTVADRAGATSVASVDLTYTPVNDNPIVNNELLFGKRGVSYCISTAALLANDTDVETPANLLLASVGNAQHGTVSLGNGSALFVPAPGYGGVASFDYVVQDSDGGQSTATAHIDFSHVNANPLAVDDSFSGLEDVVLNIAAAQLLVNDSDSDNPASSLRVAAVGNAAHGVASVDANGTVTFTPVANYNGAASFQYQVADPDGGSTWATASLSLAAVNDPPVIDSVAYWGPIDATEEVRTGGGDSGYEYTYVPVDDPYRQNGSIIGHDPDGDSGTLTYSISANPQHGSVLINQYVSSDAPPGLVSVSQAAPYLVSQSGAWQYYSHFGDTYDGPDPFQLTVTDAGGASATVTIDAVHKGSTISGGGGGKKPVTLDLDGNGLNYAGVDDSKAYFDVNGDGWREHMAWVGAGDGLLALDLDGDRIIDRANEISFISYKVGAQTDLEGLAAFDTHTDAKIDRLDARWQQLGAWVDANGDGVCDPGEFKTLDELGVASINLASDHAISTPAQGVVQFGQASFTTVDGQTHAVGDVAFSVDASHRLPASASEAPTAPASLSAADAPRHAGGNPTARLAELYAVEDPQGHIMRQALLFNQWVTSACADMASEPPMGFVANDLLTADWVQPELLALAQSQHALVGHAP
ncbi:MAG: cadherin-like domain-containing protein [Betaproteobacteria bacterium]